MATISERPAGTTEDPIRREGDMCAYKGCTRRLALLRITRTGSVVAYCDTHYNAAQHLFGKKA